MVGTSSQLVNPEHRLVQHGEVQLVVDYILSKRKVKYGKWFRERKIRVGNPRAESQGNLDNTRVDGL